MNYRTIRKYNLNPGIEDVKLILAALLAFSYPVYGVGESDGHYNITKMETGRNGVKLSSAKHAGNMWLEDPQTLCVDTSDLNIIAAVEKSDGVSFLGEYKKLHQFSI